ncbi:hypothetical protein GCM10009745_21730 [Kribbella yunnanensis]|uniref:Uncharacterized protein n=1 Tax=Kribbella yunnanensis TaxID=190194 RepID=A0ABP4STB5_9ACTN
MTDAVVTALREIANRDLYQRNAFHITGLSTGVDRRTTRRRQQHVTAVLEAGADLETSGSTDPDELRLAFDRLLGDPRRRLVDEVFGEWGRPNGDCGCDVPVHQAHDEAVYAHAYAIELLIQPPDPSPDHRIGLLNWWNAAGVRWTEAMAHPQFWQHLRDRVLTLDDWQLAAGAIDQIRGELPATLTGPLLDLATTSDYPAQVAKILERWPVGGDSRQRRLLEAMRTQYERAEDATVALLRRLQQGPHEVDPVINELGRSVLPMFRRLQVFLPSEEHQRTLTLRDDIALVYHNGAVGIANDGWVHDPRITFLFDEAEGYAGSDETRSKIAANRAAAQQLKSQGSFRAQNAAHRQNAPQQWDAEGCGCAIGILVLVALGIFLLIKAFS